MQATLSRFDAMRHAIMEAVSVDEVLEIRDKAEALRAYYKQVNEGLDSQNRVAEIKIRAERRIGELLAEMPKQNGGDAQRTRLHHETESPLSLSDIGITKTQSHRWQTMAAVPEDEFCKIVSKVLDSRAELTSKSIYQAGKSEKQTEPIVHTETIEGVCSSLDSLLSGNAKFGTIYADPPWQYSNKATRANVDSLYAGTMTIDELCAMPIRELSSPDAHLHLWTTNAFLFESNRVMDAWGFDYRSVFVWCKPQMGIGNYWRVSHEFLLLGIKGDAKRFNRRDLKSWATFNRRKHSEKPDEVRKFIQDVSCGPYLELFGRKAVSGWTVFGNQVSASRSEYNEQLFE